jgi:hypothetical protein
MRTTVDLPTPLFRRAKARAAARGETLRALLTRAVEAEVGAASPSKWHDSSGRVKLPLIGTPGGPKVNLTNADLERILAEDEARHYGLLPPARRQKR